MVFHYDLKNAHVYKLYRDSINSVNRYLKKFAYYHKSELYIYIFLKGYNVSNCIVYNKLQKERKKE